MYQTRVIQTVIALGGTPDDIILDHRGGHATIALSKDATICLSLASQDVLDKLAVITAQAAAHRRAESLKAVS